MKKYLAVMGTIGVGKTTVTSLLAKHLDLHPFLERYTNNPFLPRFYKDMPRWGFTYQTFFLLEIIKQYREIQRTLHTHSVVQDCTIYQFVYSYAKAQYEYGNMDKEEWELYYRLFTELQLDLPQPTLIIYLDASEKTILDRIEHRGREMEAEIPKEYVQLLNSLNKDWLKQTDIPILTIDTNTLNLVNNSKDQKQFITLVKDALGKS